MPETCQNCDQPIGRLETPHVYNDHIVCFNCHTQLAKQRPKQPQFTDPKANANAGKVMARVALWVIGGVIIFGLIQMITSLD